MKFYTINEFAERINVSQSALRQWDKQGILVPHHRTPGNHRIYSESQALAFLGSYNKEADHDHCTSEISLSVVISDHNVIGIDSLSDFSDVELNSMLRFINKYLLGREIKS